MPAERSDTGEASVIGPITDGLLTNSESACGLGDIDQLVGFHYALQLYDVELIYKTLQSVTCIMFRIDDNR